MGAILSNGAHPHFIAFYRILSKDKRTHKQTQMAYTPEIILRQSQAHPLLNIDREPSEGYHLPVIVI